MLFTGATCLSATCVATSELQLKPDFCPQTCQFTGDRTASPRVWPTWLYWGSSLYGFLKASFHRACENVAPIGTKTQGLTLFQSTSQRPNLRPWDLGWLEVPSCHSGLCSGIGASAHSSWPSCLTLYSLALLYISSRAHIPSDLSYLFTHCQSLPLDSSESLRVAIMLSGHLFAIKSHMCKTESDT